MSRHRLLDRVIIKGQALEDLLSRQIAPSPRISLKLLSCELVDAGALKGVLDERGLGQQAQRAGHVAGVDKKSTKDDGDQDDGRTDGQGSLGGGRGGSHGQAKRLGGEALGGDDAQEAGKAR